MGTVNKKIILARTSPRLKRSAALAVNVRAGVDKCATDTATATTTAMQSNDRSNESATKMNCRNITKIGQWNVRGLNALGKLAILSKELEKSDIRICGLSETKWSGSGHFTTMDGHTVLFSGSTEREHHGVAIWINKNTGKCLTSYTPINSRIISATFAAKPRNVTLIQCYAPTSEKPAEEIEKFYQELEQVVRQIPKRNILVITGDFNARVGEGAVESDVLGKYGHGERNEVGQAMVDFCTEHKLVITNTLFRLHNRHRYTWESPGDRQRSQIDYILISRQWKQSVNNARTCNSADCDSDHNLLILSMKLRFKKNPANTTKSIGVDFEKLQCDQHVHQYQVEISNRFEALQKVNEPRTPDELWAELKDVTLSAAKTTLQKDHCKRKNWISNDTFELINKKREARKAGLHEEYRKLRGDVQKMLRRDKQAELDELCNELEENAKKGNNRPVFRIIKGMTKQFQAKTVAIKDIDNKLQTEPEKVCQRWKEYCEELYDDINDETEIDVQEKEPPPLKEEIRRAILKLGNGKAPGPDQVAVELLKFGGDMTLNRLHEICLEVWTSGVWPEEWTQSVFIPLPKKGDLHQCSNYRTVALVSHASKILLKVILERMQMKLEEEIAPEQAGFRPRRGTRDQITNLRNILEKAREHNQPLYMCFIDFTKAFDMVRHDQLWLTMLDMGFPPHLVQLLQKLYKQQRACVRTASQTSAWFRVRKGVRQGCNVSPCLFNILAEQIMRKALHGFHGGFRIGGKIISNLRYADDIVLIATTKDDLIELTRRVEEAAREYNLLINASKTNVMSTNNETLEIYINGKRLEQVDTFVYLGSKVKNDSSCSDDVKTRLAMGMNVLVKLTRIWKNKCVSKSTKIRLMRALVWPVATYGCESWTLKKEEERRIQAFENKCVRKLLRIPWTKLMTNEEVYKMAGSKSELLNHIKSRKLRYFGHVMRKTQDSIERSLMVGLVEGIRARGRPRICWLDNVVTWTRMSGTSLLRATQDRKYWTTLTHPCSQQS